MSATDSTGKRSNSELRAAIQQLRPFFVKAGLMSLCSSLLVLAPSIYMLEVYERVVNSRSLMTLAMLTLLVVGAYIVMEVLDWARHIVMHDAGAVFDNSLRKRLFELSFEANLKKEPGGTSQTMVDLRVIREFLASPVVLAFMELPTSVFFLFFLFMTNVWLGWASLAAAVVQVLIAVANEKRSRPPLLEANRAAVAAQQYADSTLRNAQVIESMGMLRNIHRYWFERQRNVITLQAKASDIAGGFHALTKFWQLTVASALLGLGAVLQLKGLLPGGGGMMIVASILGGRVLAPLVQIVAAWQMASNARASWIRLEDLLEKFPARQSGMSLPAPKGRLSVESLHAGPPGTPIQILRGVAFDLIPGEVLAVVGPSASGKTTLARLLTGLWQARSGSVRLDGADIYLWNKAELGPHVGYLPQGVQLFDGTLAENIARFGDMHQAQVEAAARAVGLHELIMSLPRGYDTQVGDEGAILSGGQRQRIGLARAIYGDPVYVVLDEPNSNLDDAGDAALVRMITEMKARGTTFVIMTHRANILAVADKMLVLRDGRAVAFGPRDEVIKAMNQAARGPANAPARGAVVAPARI